MPTDTLPETTLETPPTPETQTETTQETKPEVKSFDPATISPETKAYFDKQYEGYEKHKGMSQEYENLLRTKEFQDWYQGLKNPKPADKFEISDEQFNSALADKGQFMSLVSQLAERIATEKLGPQLNQTRTQLEVSERTSELNRTVASHPDFMDLDKRGFIEPYLRRYPGISFEDAYKLGKSHVIDEEIDKKARGLVETKKNGGIERPSGNAGSKGSRIRVHTTEEAMSIAYDAALAGKQEPDFEFIDR